MSLGFALRRRGKALEPVRLADRTTDKLAAAGGAAAGKTGRDAVGAKSALECANHGVERLGWQVPVAALAVWPEFQHGRLLAEQAGVQRLPAGAVAGADQPGIGGERLIR